MAPVSKTKETFRSWYFHNYTKTYPEIRLSRVDSHEEHFPFKSLRLGFLLVLGLTKEDYLQIFEYLSFGFHSFCS